MEQTGIIHVEYNGAVLLAVPSIHYRIPFADWVNSICRESRPDAIAVELGPIGAKCVLDVLKEIGVGPNSYKKLPYMLGLLKKNHIINPKHRKVALTLQEQYRKPLSELPPEVLRKHLDYSPYSLLPITASDSIIEALRCALELEVPVYGVDIEDFAHVSRGNILIEDPINAQNNLNKYVQHNEHFSETCRDSLIDGRREKKMVAQLKNLLGRHKKVMFVCGLAHWNRIKILLNDNNLKQSNDIQDVRNNYPSNSVNYVKVLLHPVVSAQFMDIFPACTCIYEDNRKQANELRRDNKRINYKEKFRDEIKEAFDKYFILSNESLDDSQLIDQDQIERKFDDLQNKIDFEQYLYSVCLLNQREVPDLAITLQTAEVMMSKRFYDSLTNSLMDISPFRWESPKNWLDLPLVNPAPITESEKPYIRIGEKVEIRMQKKPKGFYDEMNYDRSIPFYIDPHKDNYQQKENYGASWNWEDNIPPPPPRDGVDGSNPFTSGFVWPPCEMLFYATAYEAAKIAREIYPEKKTQIFEGSLYDGIDIKSTIRAKIRQEGSIYVNETIKKNISSRYSEPDLQPVVFIFSDSEKTSVDIYDPLVAGSYKKNDPYFRDFFINDKNSLKLFDKEVKDSEITDFIESISLFSITETSDNLKNFIQYIRNLKGAVRFGNPCIDNEQGAKWLMKGEFKCCPIIKKTANVSSIVEHYTEEYKFHIDLSEWQSTLVLFAIPFSSITKRVIVVAPDYFTVNSYVEMEARKSDIELIYVPLSYFKADRIREIKTQYVVKAAKGGKDFPEELERILGQKQDCYFDLLPKEVASQIIEE
jgi:hypothetical protein